jgi:hypothetical protein
MAHASATAKGPSVLLNRRVLGARGNADRQEDVRQHGDD